VIGGFGPGDAIFGHCISFFTKRGGIAGEGGGREAIGVGGGKIVGTGNG
jgi:hypothetical protein